MTEKELTKHDVSVMPTSVQTIKEFEELLGVYKIKNPAKYAEKEARGEFDAFRASLDPKRFAPAVVKTEEKVDEPKVEEPKVAKKVEKKSK